MQRKELRLLLCLALATCLMANGFVLAGDLEPPPGPPSPTMVTLLDIYGQSRGSVPATGQTTCWNSGGGSIACASTEQDGETQIGETVNPRFSDIDDGTIKDNLTGLIWLKNANCYGLINWSTALANGAALADPACGLSDLSAVGDWRVPNARELLTLMDYGQVSLALPSGHPFTNPQAFVYWSSTTNLASTSFAWGVNFNDGDLSNGSSKNSTSFVIFVRNEAD